MEFQMSLQNKQLKNWVILLYVVDVVDGEKKKLGSWPRLRLLIVDFP